MNILLILDLAFFLAAVLKLSLYFISKRRAKKEAQLRINPKRWV